MTKTLYEEALADVKRVKEIAEANAKNAIMEAIAPSVKDMIERQLFGESDNDQKAFLSHDTLITSGDHEIVETDESMDELDGASGALGVTHPAVEESTEYEVTTESLESLLPFSQLVKPIVDDKIEIKVYHLGEATNELVTTEATVRSSDEYLSKINNTIREIEDMYSYLQESGDSSRKNKLENKLESFFRVLTSLQETTMRMKDLMAEEQDVTLKISGLPDDLELDKLDIDLISDEGEETELGVEPAGELPGDEEGVPPMDVPPEMPSDMDDMEELASMDDMDEDAVVEISESMLKREIAKMKAKKLAEASKVAPVNAQGHKIGSEVLADFGGGADEGDAWLDGEVSDKDKDNMVKQGKTTMKESDDLDEVDDLDEADDDMDEADDLDEAHEDITGKMDDDHLPESKNVNAKAKALAEAKKQAFAASKKMNEAKALFDKYKDTKHEKKARSLAEQAHKALVAAKALVAERGKKLAEAKNVMKESLKNSGSKQLAETAAKVESLRKQLTETNLLNAKLIHANKLLQTEGLSSKQKAIIIDKLDEAQNLREVKLVYESLVKALSGDKKPVNEAVAGRQVLGSSSRPTKQSGAAMTNEGYETDRWAVLAGLRK